MKNLIRLILLCFVLSLSNAQATSLYFDPSCPNINGVITTPIPDDSCSLNGILSEVVNLYEAGVCNTHPSIGAIGASTNFSSCIPIYKSTTPIAVDIVQPPNLPNAVLPPTGSYSYSYLIISNVTNLKAQATFNLPIMMGHNVGTSTTCYTNGSTTVEAGLPYDLSGNPIPNAYPSGDVNNNWAVDCGSGSATANQIQHQYLNGKNPTTFMEDLGTPLGNMDIYYVNDQLLMPIIPNPQPADGTSKNIGVTKIVAVFSASSPILISNNVDSNGQTCTTSGLDIQMSLSHGNYIDHVYGQNTNNPSTDGRSKITYMGLEPFYFGFQSQPVTCLPTVSN